MFMAGGIECFSWLDGMFLARWRWMDDFLTGVAFTLTDMTGSSIPSILIMQWLTRNKRAHEWLLSKNVIKLLDFIPQKVPMDQYYWSWGACLFCWLTLVRPNDLRLSDHPAWSHDHLILAIIHISTHIVGNIPKTWNHWCMGVLTEYMGWPLTPIQ